MARIRSLKPSFFTDADLAELSPLHRLAFQGLWCHADKLGRLEDKPRELKIKILPYDDCDFDSILSELASRDFIRRYGVAGRHCIYIPNFLKHQKPHPKEPASELPEPPVYPADTRPVLDEPRKETAGPVPTNGQSGGFLSLGSGLLSLDPPPPASRSGEEEGFLEFWRKKGGADETPPAELQKFLAAQKATYGPAWQDVVGEAVALFHGNEKLRSHRLETFLKPKVAAEHLAEAAHRLRRLEPHRRHS